MSDDIKEWVDLKCPECGVMDLLKTVKVRWKQGGGTNEQPSGYKCSACMTNFDTAYIVQRAELAEKRKRAQAQLAEVEALEQVTPSSRKAKVAG